MNQMIIWFYIVVIVKVMIYGAIAGLITAYFGWFGFLFGFVIGAGLTLAYWIGVLRSVR